MCGADIDRRLLAAFDHPQDVGDDPVAVERSERGEYPLPFESRPGKGWVEAVMGGGVEGGRQDVMALLRFQGLFGPAMRTPSSIEPVEIVVPVIHVVDS